MRVCQIGLERNICDNRFDDIGGAFESSLLTCLNPLTFEAIPIHRRTDRQPVSFYIGAIKVVIVL